MSLVGLSSSYFAFKGFSIYDSVKQAHKLGFETVELGAGHNSKNSEKNVWRAINALKKDFSELNFTVHGLFPPMRKPTWFNAALGLTVENKKILEDMFRAAEAVEALCVTIHSGAFSQMLFGKEIGGMNYGKSGKSIPREKAFEGMHSVVEFALKLSEKTGIRIGMENNPQGSFRALVYSI
ncbi:MAG: TIM barrel protein, partial [Candidatus Diapherotrites archaeon]|nr:TIM barrel protein [Candidatus Diapherotrites archaeon]